MKISIIIPTLNEAENLGKILDKALTGKNVEVIVSDGGSVDGTIEIAQKYAVKVVLSEKGRAVQMNTGADKAEGDILLFLHGDTVLPDKYDVIIMESLKDGDDKMGAFGLKIDSSHKKFRIIEALVKFRSYYLKMPYGDQGLFLKAKTFKQVGGFPNLIIMEDFEFVRKIKKIGNLIIVPQSVITSSRRWESVGIIKTTLINQVIILGYLIGVSPVRLKKLYCRI